jgi:hypothetical protein
LRFESVETIESIDSHGGAVMSELIRFQPANHHRVSAPPDGGAKILFFTGVRYCRTGEDQRAPAPNPPCGAPRKGKGAAAHRGDRARRR